MQKETRTVIPAAPGFDVVDLCRRPDELAYIPIVAWIVEIPDSEAYPYARPVCIDWNSNDPDRDSVIRQPNGDIVFVDGPTFRKGRETEALAHAIKEYERRTAVREAWTGTKMTP